VAAAGTMGLGEVVVYCCHAPHRRRLAPFFAAPAAAGSCQGRAQRARQNFRFIKALISLLFVSIGGSILFA